MQIESVALNKIIPYIRNPRKNENAVEKVASSIKEFGFRQPIVVDSENVIIAGHTRFEAAKRLGLDVVPIHVADGLTEQQAKAYRIADNRVGQEAEWDYDLLKLELEELDNPELTGFDEDELKGIIAEVGEGMTGEEGLTDPDYVPEVPDEPVTVSGDLWKLGEHRLLCGDATKKEDVERMMDGVRADMVFTDPPYALFGNSTGVAGVTDDKMVRPFFRNVFGVCRDNTKLYSHIYVCCDWHSAFSLEGVAREQNLTPKNLCIWDKGDGGVGAMYQQCYEMVWFFACSPVAKKTHGVKKIGDGERTINGKPNIWRHKRATKDRKHNAQKPVGMIENAIINSSDIGGICIDFFQGSGTTLIACQKTGRKCFGMEIDPHYCDVIITRWSEFTGKDDLLLNGKPFKWSERKIKKAA